MASVGIIHPSLISFVHLNRTQLLSEPQFFHLQNGAAESSFVRFLRTYMNDLGWMKDSWCRVGQEIGTTQKAQQEILKRLKGQEQQEANTPITG